MREFVWTYNDDMYTNMAFDPEAKIHVLATAHDAAAAYDPRLTGPKYPAAAYTPEKLKAMKGIDADHPQVWTADYGKGRVFSITLGHDEVSLHFQPLQTLIPRTFSPWGVPRERGMWREISSRSVTPFQQVSVIRRQVLR